MAGSCWSGHSRRCPWAIGAVTTALAAGAVADRTRSRVHQWLTKEMEHERKMKELEIDKLKLEIEKSRMSKNA